MATVDDIARYVEANRRLELDARRARRGLLLASVISALMWAAAVVMAWRWWRA